MLIVLTFLHPIFKGRTEVYQWSLLLTFVVSLFDGLNAANIPIQAINVTFSKILPLYDAGLGWICPAFIGGCIGYFIFVFRMKFITSTPKTNH